MQHLTTDERTTLEAWISAPSRDSATRKRALRAAIILDVASGFDPRAVATRHHIQASTVDKWWRRFVQDRLAGLLDRPRSGAPRRISSERVADVLERSVEPTPQAARPWSRRMLARATGLSRSTVHRILSAPNRRTTGQ